VLSRTLRSAEIIRIDSSNEADRIELLKAAKVDAFATSRDDALILAAKLPTWRVLPDRFFVNPHAVAVPKGMAGRLAYVGEFIEQAKASGFVQQAIGRSGIHGVQVAPPAAPSAETEIRVLFDRFILAQNAHNLATVGEQLLDSPRLLWITGGPPVFGRVAALKRSEAVFQGTWHVEPKLDELQVTLLREDVAQLYVPIVLTMGPSGQAAQTSRSLGDQVLVKTAQGWQVASFVVIPAP
jgi:hypothetical protein